ncbi:MAG: O-antigen ligase family protein [Candidatus Marinimicrobia bacterium]|nr:O-antigen ligase family protein [Candidatus Neomarinimicrobiota bacterium]
MKIISSIDKKVIVLVIVLDIIAIGIGILPIAWAMLIGVGAIGLVFITHFPLFGISIFLVGSYLFSFFIGESQIITIVLVAIALTGTTLYYIDRNIPYRNLQNDYATLSFVLFSGLLIVGFFYTPNKVYAVSKIYRYFMFNSLAFMIPFIFSDDIKSLKKLYANIFYVALGLVILSSILILSTNSYTYSRFNLDGRMNPIWIARIIGVGILISLYYLQQIRDRKTKSGLVLYIFIGLWIIVLTGSRAPIIALLVSAMVFMMFIQKRSHKFKILTIAGALSFSTILLMLIPSTVIMSKYTTIGSKVSVLQRFALWEKAIEISFDNPFIGKGTGGFQLHSLGFSKYPHNIFLETSSELGLIGLVIMISFFFRPFWDIPQMFDKDRAFSVLMLSLWVFVSFNAQFSGDVTGNYLVWFFIGSWIVLSSEKVKVV